MYQSLIRSKFPHDEAMGFFRSPKLPAVRLGKILRRESRISSPSDVLGMYDKEGFFGGRYVLFTATTTYFDGGSFALEDVRGATAAGAECVVQVNRQGMTHPVTLKLNDDEAATLLYRFLNDLAHRDLVAESVMQSAYEGFDPAQVQWLGLRDEVMRTIDLLYERYNDGKISLLDYESKKEALLARL